jgi:hypothetical protein
LSPHLLEDALRCGDNEFEGSNCLECKVVGSCYPV